MIFPGALFLFDFTLSRDKSVKTNLFSSSKGVAFVNLYWLAYENGYISKKAYDRKKIIERMIFFFLRK